ncbi:MAG: TIGR03643 family protein [Campylobacterales bacterium]|nr:TIGR03643 family protein [Campylobacterales bacterium]
MNYKKLQKPKPAKTLDLELLEDDLNRLIEMAWQDRTTFDGIYLQYGLKENEVKKKMRKLISKKAYNRWRKRVQGRSTKHKSLCDHKPTRFQGPW